MTVSFMLVLSLWFNFSCTVRRRISESQLSEIAYYPAMKLEMWLTKVDLLFTILNKTYNEKLRYLSL